MSSNFSWLIILLTLLTIANYAIDLFEKMRRMIKRLRVQRKRSKLGTAPIKSL